MTWPALPQRHQLPLSFSEFCSSPNTASWFWLRPGCLHLLSPLPGTLPQGLGWPVQASAPVSPLREACGAHCRHDSPASHAALSRPCNLRDLTSHCVICLSHQKEHCKSQDRVRCIIPWTRGCKSQADMGYRYTKGRAQ